MPLQASTVKFSGSMFFIYAALRKPAVNPIKGVYGLRQRYREICCLLLTDYCLGYLLTFLLGLADSDGLADVRCVGEFDFLFGIDVRLKGTEFQMVPSSTYLE
jgi:hypothetical protein